MASRLNRSASSGSIVKQSPSEIKASPTADILVKSSSSSSLLALAENKKDSPTKSQLMRRSSNSSIPKRSPRASPTSTSSSLLLAENEKDSPTKSSKQQQAEEPKSSDTATILESLATAEKEKEQLATFRKSSESLADKQPTAGTQEETSSAAAVVSTTSEPKSESAVEPKSDEQQQQPSPAKEDAATATATAAATPSTSPTKMAIKIPENKKDSPKTPDSKRGPRASAMLAQDISAAEACENSMQQATLERLERISASPVSVDSMDAVEAKEWLTEPASPQKNTTPSSSTGTEEEEEAEEAQPSPSKPFVRTQVPRNASLQWHEGPQTSSRTIPKPEPNKLLPSPPSMRQSDTRRNDEVVAVFNANTSEGKSMVRALAKSGSQVVAIVRVFTSRNTKSLLKLGKNVVVKVADSHDEAALAKAVEGAHRAFLVTTYWERFDSALEEKQAYIVLNACASQNVHHLVLSSFEDTRLLREKGLKSQIVPRRDGTITPKFEGMQALKEAAEKLNVQLTHMITSYVDQENSKKSLCLIVGENGNLLVNSHFPDES